MAKEKNSPKETTAIFERMTKALVKGKPDKKDKPKAKSKKQDFSKSSAINDLRYSAVTRIQLPIKTKEQRTNHLLTPQKITTI